MLPAPASLWRRFLGVILVVVRGFGAVIFFVVMIWIGAFALWHLFIPRAGWEVHAFLATLIAGVAMVNLAGEAILVGFFTGLWWGLKALWRHCRR